MGGGDPMGRASARNGPRKGALHCTGAVARWQHGPLAPANQSSQLFVRRLPWFPCPVQSPSLRLGLRTRLGEREREREREGGGIGGGGSDGRFYGGKRRHRQ